ncbi:MAG: acyltransferase [Gemmatimonadetes bacterium]|nr:acyltransferase [Gemmatimonadota bacterium]
MADERSSQLDVLRALGLTAVIFQHTFNPHGPLVEEGPALALTLFFVLSGFLITGILLDARKRAEETGVGRGGVLGRFYIRRFLRIVPVYYAAIAISVLLGDPATRQYLWELVTYRTNFLLANVGHNIPPITPLWSLAVEEHFYLLWPLVALFASRRLMWGTSLSMVVISVASRAYEASRGAAYQTITMPTYASLDGIAIGCMLAMAWRETTLERRESWIRRLLVVGGVVLVARMALMYVGGYRSIVHTLHTLPFALVGVWLIDRGARGLLPRIFGARWLAPIGVSSYGAYLMHRFVMHYLGFDGERGLHVFVPVLLISVGLSALSWRFFEGPLNDLKRYFPYVPRRAPRLVAAGPRPSFARGTPTGASMTTQHTGS